MALLFRPYPTIGYRIPGTSRSIPVTDITRRFTLSSFLQNARVNFDEYYVQDGETPQGVAFDYYGDVTLDWVVLFSNEIQDPYYEWPMSTENFDSYIKQKYGSQYAYQTVHHYEWITQQSQVKVENGIQRILPEKSVTVDYTTYLTLTAPERRAVTIYDHEAQRNEDRRTIYLIDLHYTQIFKDQHPFIFSEGAFVR